MMMKSKGLKYLVLSLFLLASCSSLFVRSSARHEFEEGLALFNRGMYKVAIPHFEKAIDIDPDYAKPHLYLGRSYLNLNMWVKAVPPLRSAWRLSPNETRKEMINVLIDAFLGAATSEFTKGNYGESVKYLKEGLELSPESGEIKKELISSLLVLGSKLFSEGKLDEALSAFSEALEFAPDNSDAYIGIAKILLRKGDYLEAIKTVNKALSLDPDNQAALSLFKKMLQR